MAGESYHAVPAEDAEAALDQPERPWAAEEQPNPFSHVRDPDGGSHDVRIHCGLGGDEHVEHAVVGLVVAVEEDHPVSGRASEPGDSRLRLDDVNLRTPGRLPKLPCVPRAVVVGGDDGDA